MTDEVVTDAVDHTPGAIIVDEYLADFSIENPGGRVPADQAPELVLGLDVAVHAAALAGATDATHGVQIVLGMPARLGDRVIFLIEMRYQVNVKLQGVDEADISELLYVQIPEAVFPTLKAIVEKNGAFAGYPGVVLFPIDFAAIFHSRMQELTQA
jgi:preprotein translocase subunit SecB